MSTQLNKKMSYKVVFVGDGGVGKTTFLKRIKTGQFEHKYLATVGVEAIDLSFTTNYGEVKFICWDCAGQDKYGGLREGYYLGGDAAVVMFDLTHRQTYKSAYEWCAKVRHVCPGIPIVICGNKCDDPNRKVESNSIRLHDLYRNIDAQYYDISAKTLYNQDKPFLSLARQLTGKDDLVFQ